MDLVIFDIDGTLIRSMEDDGDCYVAALEDVFGFTGIDADWSHYEHTTDAGILDELFRRRCKRPPRSGEVSSFCGRFVELLAERCVEQGLEEIPGARRLLDALEHRDDLAGAFATGAWRAAAAVKMSSAGLSLGQFPSATCDDAVSRHEIMQAAVRRAAHSRGVDGFENVVYVGDAVWDVRACRRLAIPFIGVTADVASDRLRAEGVEFVLADFLDHDLFHQYRLAARNLVGGK